MPSRLDLKLAVALSVIVILVSTAYGLILVRTQNQRSLDTMVLGAGQLSKSITSATWHAMLDDNREAAYDIMRVIAQKQGVDGIRIFNREGRLMFSTRHPGTDADADERSSLCASCHAGGTAKSEVPERLRYRITTRADGHRTLSMITPVYNEPSCSDAACHAHPASVRVLGVVDVALGLDPLESETASISTQVLVATLIQVAIIILFIFSFTRRFVTRPIRELIAGTQAVSEMDLDRPIVIRYRSRELDSLVDSFNRMRERLQKAMAELNEFTQQLETKVAQRTEQLKAAHQKLLHTDRLASLGQLSASVAHEINNPIGGVLNLAMLMQRILRDDGIPRGREVEFRNYLGQVVQQTSRVGHIVSDLLAFSRRSKPQRAPADLNKIVTTTVSLVAHKLRLSNVDCELNLAAGIPVLTCDSSQIQQVVLTLVMNAAEATQNRPERKVRVTTRMSINGQALELIVEDNGDGIRPENLDKIFDPFFTTKPEGKGVGLGLAVLYGIVKAHDGEVDVQSTPGEGARFIVTLPLEPRANGAELPVVEVMHADPAQR
jgi:two-component system NtrC family sensor kinase